MNLRSTQSRLLIIVIISVLLVVLVFMGSRAVVRETTGGFDLLTHWKGAQLLLQENLDPYLSTTTEQLNLFLNSVGKHEDSKINRFEKPLYALLFYAPLTVFKDIENVRSVWMTLNVLLLLVSGYVLYKLVKLRIPLLLFIGLAVFLLFSYPSFSSLLSGSLSIASLLFLILSIAAVIKTDYESAGLLLAFSLVDIEFSGIPVFFLIVWSLINRHYRIIGWFMITLLFLVGFSMLFLPIWPVHYVVSVFEQGLTGTSVSSGDFNPVLQSRFIVTKNVILFILLFIEWFMVKTRDNSRVLWLVFLTFSISLLILNQDISEKAVAIFPAIFLSIQVFSRRFQRRISSVIMLLLSVVFLISWFLSGWLLPGIQVFSAQLSSVVLVVVSLILLYWVRWWITKPTAQLEV